MRNIVFASDFSKASRRAFAAALKTAKESGGTLTIVHVLAPLVPIGPDQYIGPETWEELDQRAHEWATRQLNALAAKAQAAGVKAKIELRQGQAAKEVTRVARKLHAGQVVIGTHGRTGFAKLLLGSIASQIVATSRCPVMTVRG